MTNASAYRRSMTAGVAFVVLFIVGALFTNDSPSTKSADSAAAVDQKWLTYLSDSGHRIEHVIGAYLLILAGIAFIWFCSGIRQRLETAGVVDATVGRVVSGLAVFGAGAMAAAGMVGADIPGAVAAGGEKLPVDGAVAHWIADMAFPFLFVVFGLISAVLIAVLTVAAMRSDMMARWLTYGGWVAVLGSLGAIIFMPMVLPLLWYLAVAISGLVRTPTSQPIATAMSPAASPATSV